MLVNKYSYDKNEIMNSAGDIAEIAFLHEAYKRGYKAFIPYSHDTKVDVVIKRPGESLISVQIKKGTKQRLPEHYTQAWKALVGSAKSSNRNNTGTPRFTKYQNGAFHILAIYIQELNQFALFKLKDVAGKASIRWTHKQPIDNWDTIHNYHEQTKH